MLFMKTLLTDILIPAGVIIVLAALIMFVLPLLVVLIGLAFLAAFVCWACGVPISVAVNEKKVGYIRWFKFTRL